MSPHVPTWLMAAIATACLIPHPALAQALATAKIDGRWVGRRVVTPFGTVIRGGVAEADDPNAKELALAGRGRQEFRVYKVERAEGDRLWLASECGAVRGWITAVEAIPIERAVEHYTARIADSPADATNYANRAAIRDVLGDLDRALLDGNEAIRIDPNNAMAYHNRGYTWARKKDLDRAIADFTRAIQLDPQYARAYNKRGFAWLEKKSYDRARADFTRAIQLDPKFAGAYHNRGNSMLRQKDYGKAIADYTHAIRLDSRDDLVFIDRASVHRALGDESRALADLTEAIRRKPDRPEALVGRAWLLATSPSGKIRDGKRAVADAARACELTRWKEAFPLGALAAASAESGDFAQAVKHQERAQALYKGRDDIARGRARLDLYKARTPYREPPEPAPTPPSMGRAPA